MSNGTTDVQTPENGIPVTPDSTTDNYEEKYKALQADYTKKAQELAELKKAREENGGLSDEEKQLLEWNKKQGFVTKDELEGLRSEAEKAKQIAQETEFRDLLRISPELKQFESAIRTIHNAEGGSFEEIALKHKFTSADKLEKAKMAGGRLIGDGAEPQKEKSIDDMSSAEWEQYVKENKLGKSQRTKKDI